MNGNSPRGTTPAGRNGPDRAPGCDALYLKTPSRRDDHQHIRNVSAESATVAGSIEETSTTLAAVDEAARRISDTVAKQRASTEASAATLAAASERLVQIAERESAPA